MGASENKGRFSADKLTFPRHALCEASDMRGPFSSQTGGNLRTAT